jgi:hypothetical protein
MRSKNSIPESSRSGGTISAKYSAQEAQLNHRQAIGRDGDEN